MKDVLYIIEGPDGTGKSTLSEKIGNILNIPVKHFTYYKDKHQLTDQFVKGHEMLSLMEDPCIFDRYILSNIVYGIVFHDCEYVNGWLLWLTTMLSGVSVRKNIHLVFCLPEKNSWIKRFEKLCKERDEMYVDIEKMSKVYDLFLIFYEMISSNTNIKVSIIDPFVENVEKILNNEE